MSLQLASPREGVRKKVMELLVHVNKRIKGNDRIRRERRIDIQRDTSCCPKPPIDFKTEMTAVKV